MFFKRIRQYAADNKFYLSMCVLLFVAFFALAYIFPYSGDDWGWGSEAGAGRLENWFDNYNGRYTGNILVILLTRSPLFKALLEAVSLLLIVLLPKLYTGSSRSVTLSSLGAMLLLITPRMIFRQAIVWTSGFANYVPSILMTAFFFIIAKDAFADELPEYSAKKTVITSIALFAASFLGAMFMENITLNNIVMAALVLGYTIVRFKKVLIPHLSYFVGSVVGAICMFTNSAYFTINSGEDFYRDVITFDNLGEMIADTGKVICTNFFENSVFLFIIFSLLLLLATWICCAKSDAAQGRKTASLVSLIVNLVALGLIYFKSQYTAWNTVFGNANAGVLVFGIIVIVYCLSALVNIIASITDTRVMLTTLLPLISVPVQLIQLLVVTPIGPRNFFPTYVLMIMVIGVLFNYALDFFNPSRNALKLIASACLSVSLASLIFITSIFTTIHSYEVKRHEYIKLQLEAGYTEIVVCNLPYSDFMQYPNPENKYALVSNFKNFYGIDKDVKFKLLNPQNFIEWTVEFDKEVKNK